MDQLQMGSYCAIWCEEDACYSCQGLGSRVSFWAPAEFKASKTSLWLKLLLHVAEETPPLEQPEVQSHDQLKDCEPHGEEHLRIATIH